MPFFGISIRNGLSLGLGTVASLSTDFALRPSLDLVFAGASSLDSQVTFTRTSSATYFDATGTLQTATDDQPRFDYDPSTLAAKGLLIEEAKTNLLLHNRDLTNVAWVATNITPLKNQTGIDGVTNSASLITATSANGTILQSVTSASAARFTSAYVKRVTGTGTIEMTQDGGSTWASVSVTSAWTRVNIASATITNPSVGFRIVDSGDEIAVDGVQLETGSFATSVIFTTSATVGRARDEASVNTLSPWFNAAEGTLYAEAVSIATAAAAVASIDDGTSANTINISPPNNTGAVFFSVVVANVSQLTGGSRSGTTLPFKAGIAYKTNDTSWTINGTTPTDDLTVSLPTVTKMNIGSRGAASIPYSGWIRRITYYPRRLSNAELQAITS